MTRLRCTRSSRPAARSAFVGLGLGAVLVCGSALAHAEPNQTLKPFRADYEVWVDGSDAGESRIELLAGNSGLLQHRVNAMGTRGLARLARFSTDQSADLQLSNGEVQLVSAKMSASSLLRDRDLSVRFDWARGELHWDGDVDKKQPRNRPIEGIPATGSSLNLQLGLAAMRQPAGQRLEYVLHDRGKASVLDYVIGAAETIEVPAGRFRAIPVRGERPEKQRITTAWYAEGLPPTPVRVLQMEKGKAKFELRLKQVES